MNSLLKSKYFQSSLLTIMFGVLFVCYVPKYKAKKTFTRPIIENEKHFYIDLNNDGTSEYVRYHKYKIGSYNRACIHVLDIKDNYIGIWNLNGEFIDFPCNYFPIEDYNNDGVKEIFAFCTRNDSIFISGIDYRKDGELFVNHKFIDTTGLFKGKLHFNTMSIGSQDINNDSLKEIYFAISAGYTLRPRKIYALDVKNDTLYKSPDSFIPFFNGFIMYDLNNDGKKEILAPTNATDNIRDTAVYPYHDKSAWLMAFTHDLKFLFSPFKINSSQQNKKKQDWQRSYTMSLGAD